MKHLAIFFFTGDFEGALRRYRAGLPQNYATHDEICRLIDNVVKNGWRLTIYSFLSQTRRTVQVGDAVTFVELGATSWNQTSILVEAVRKSDADAFIPHFANVGLIKACAETGKPVLCMMANSSNVPKFLEWIRMRRLVRLLNDGRIDFVSNHCLPSTLQLARVGVSKAKLLPWDVPHQFTPEHFDAKERASEGIKIIAYAGSVSEAKGVGDLIRGLASDPQLRHDARLVIAGAGDLEQMKALANKEGVSESVEFLGLIENSRVLELFRTADVVCVPSRREFGEGFPLTMFEAIASRTPIICSDHPMFTPIMKNEVNAMVVAEQDVECFAQALKRLIYEPELYGMLSRNATNTWALLSQTADWRTLIEEWMEDRSSQWLQSRTLAATQYILADGVT